MGHQEAPSNPPAAHIAVLGAGVIGLCTALSLLKRNQLVTIVSASWPGDTTNPHYTSMYSGAQWRSNPPLDDLQQQAWDRATIIAWREITAKVDPAESGLEMRPAEFYYDAPGPRDGRSVEAEHWWSLKALVPVMELEAEKCQARGFVKGFAYETVAVNPELHCRWLLSKCEALGAKRVTAQVESLEQVFDAVPGAVGLANCAGLAAEKLVGDEAVFPTKGQTLLVRGKANLVATRRNEAGEEPWEALVIPRPGREDITLLGGCKWAGDWSTEPDENMTKVIMERCKPLAPELLNGDGEFDIVAVKVGLRPSRIGGPRVEVEEIAGDKIVCHNYGHHSAGFEGSIGGGDFAADLLLGTLRKKSSKASL